MLQTSCVTLNMSFPSLGLSFPICAGLAPCHLPSADGLCFFPTPQQPPHFGGCPPQWLVMVGRGQGCQLKEPGTGTEGQEESRNQACLLLPRITSSPLLKIMSC